MNFRVTATAAALVFAIAGSAHAQSKIPSITSLWDETNLSQRDCNTRAERAMRNAGFTRIETIGQTTFGDRTDYQVGFRCVQNKGMYYIFGGGPDEPVVRRYIDELKSEFSR
jgi:hypothetical protein